MLKQGLMLAAATLALAACNGRNAEQTAADATAAAGNSLDAAGAMATDAAAGMATIGATAQATAAEFVQRMAISDMYEIESSKLAQTRSKSPEVIAFAKQMVTDHTATTAKVKSITAGDAALKPPAAMDEAHLKLVADLKAATPDAFDTLYLDQQTDAHETAHGLLESYASGGDNAALKAFAAETAPKVQMHLDMARKLDKGGADDAAPGTPRP